MESQVERGNGEVGMNKRGGWLILFLYAGRTYGKEKGKTKTCAKGSKAPPKGTKRQEARALICTHCPTMDRWIINRVWFFLFLAPLLLLFTLLPLTHTSYVKTPSTPSRLSVHPTPAPSLHRPQGGTHDSPPPHASRVLRGVPLAGWLARKRTDGHGDGAQVDLFEMKPHRLARRAPPAGLCRCCCCCRCCRCPALRRRPGRR